jgi:hypothetical protein
MSGRLMKYICIFFVLLFIQSVAFAEPEWFGNTSSIPAIYDGTTVAEFNISLNDTGTDYAIDTVFIELNWTGTPTNYTMTNDTYGGHIYNYTNVIGANNNNSQYWKVFFNNTTDSWNTSDTWEFTIGKASVPLVLENNNSWSGTYLDPTNTTGSGCPAQLTDCNLYRNDTDVNSTDNGIAKTFEVGAYNYTYNTSGNENYSANTTSNILVINKAPTSISLWLNETEGSKSYNINDTANFTAVINVTGLTINLTSNYTGFGQLNGTTSIENTTNLTEQGLFYINASSEGNENYSSTSTVYYFDTTAPQYTIISPSSYMLYSLNRTYWFNTSWAAATVEDVWFGFANSTSSFSLYNSTDIQNSSGIYSVNITDLPVENYTYFWCANRSATENKTNCTGNITFNVTKDTGYIMWYIDPSLSVTYGTATNITCLKDKGDPSSIIRLYREGSSIDSDTITVEDYNSALAEGTYVYNCTINESQNYTFYSYSQTLTINAADFVPSGGGSDTTTTSSGVFTITPSDSKVTVEKGSSKNITLTLKNTRSSDISDIGITLSGISIDWYSFDKTSIDKLRHDTGLEDIMLTLNIPEDANEATYSIKIKVSGKNFDGSISTIQTTIQLDVTEPSQEEEIVEAVLNTEETPASDNETEVLPTGFLNASSEYIPYIIPVLGITASVLIFLKRDDITVNLMGLIGTNVPEKQTHKKSKKSKKHKHKKHPFKKFTYKLSINLKKENKPKTLEIEEEKADKLEREIKRDMKELENIIETEKKIKKRRK